MNGPFVSTLSTCLFPYVPENRKIRSKHPIKLTNITLAKIKNTIIFNRAWLVEGLNGVMAFTAIG